MRENQNFWIGKPFLKSLENGYVLTGRQTDLHGLTSLDTTLNSESEDEDTQTVNDDKAIPSDHPHPGKLMFMTLRLLLISALTDWKRLLSSIPMLQQTCLYIHYPCFLKLWNLKSNKMFLIVRPCCWLF
ncbi:hypothetical protein NC653_040864 [Populus alba x Populus x berolinensis]|uniref:Uncharacterized protein n=1 Tax=Populus alba x Populus x berolinensis TaxID=444605 RepID=A0AAD6L730_9ROSI|nr:hypothetical protein NC653_040831 [Populus alba x Populus x berolinensis]KAJ6951514.1 hypothetical protein NC653_040835 [Populus alba x Populus x berolinensis]KAJ6951550.1 hypothetical protein NC653_040864 [Populus alba x Populus x berolinensis]